MHSPIAHSDYLVAGFWGATVCTIGIFLPSFLFVLIVARSWFDTERNSPSAIPLEILKLYSQPFSKPGLPRRTAADMGLRRGAVYRPYS
jgi:hypothetical protein